jgi:amino acid permease
MYEMSRALFAPVAFTVDAKTGAGWLGLVSYSLFIGLPIILVAYLGTHIKERYPKVSSLGQFTRERFGPAVELLVTLLVIFNLFIGMIF